MAQRVQLHEQATALLQAPPPGIEIVDICPPDSFTAGRFTRKLSELQYGYEAGLEAATRAIGEWQQRCFAGHTPGNRNAFV